MAPMSLPPGFRFHPTDEELVAYYLERKITGRSIELDIIPEVDLYKCEPWDLPEKSFLPSKDLEWYFYSPRDRKYPNGTRTNRATKAGYWKATGKDKAVHSQKHPVGMRKTLVYYKGRAPRGVRTNWVMHEYRLAQTVPGTTTSLKDSYSLCRIFKKTIQMSKSENEKQAEDEYYKKSMRISSQGQVFRDDDSSGNEICRETENADEKVANHKHPNSSSDLTQGTPTAENNIADDLQPQYACDEANSTADNPYSLTMEHASNLFQDAELPIYGSLQCQFPYPPPLELQDFPQISLLEPKPMKQEMPMEECISSCDKYRDFMNIGTLEEIILLCSSQDNPINAFPMLY